MKFQSGERAVRILKMQVAVGTWECWPHVNCSFFSVEIGKAASSEDWKGKVGG